MVSRALRFIESSFLAPIQFGPLLLPLSRLQSSGRVRRIEGSDSEFAPGRARRSYRSIAASRGARSTRRFACSSQPAHAFVVPDDNSWPGADRRPQKQIMTARRAARDRSIGASATRYASSRSSGFAALPAISRATASTSSASPTSAITDKFVPASQRAPKYLIHGTCIQGNGPWNRLD